MQLNKTAKGKKMKTLITTVKLLSEISVELIRFNGVNDEGGYTLQEDFEFSDEDSAQEVTVEYGFNGYVEECCGGYPVFSIKFVIHGFEFGNSVQTEIELEKIIILLTK